MLLIIDNYDSFVFNIVRYCAELGHPAKVIRNDALTSDQIADLAPAAIVISPGPASPTEAGVSLEVVQRFSGQIPLLGVCLGHQCIGATFGGRIARAQEPMHGRSSDIRHDGNGLFAGLPHPLTVGRYHSLVVEETRQMQPHLSVTARTSSGEVMALTHRTHPTMGVQFHPESVLSQHGHDLFQNFLTLAQRWRADAVA